MCLFMQYTTDPELHNEHVIDGNYLKGLRQLIINVIGREVFHTIKYQRRKLQQDNNR